MITSANTLKSMRADLIINASLAVLAYIVNAVGIHVSASPIKASDAKKTLWKRRRTWIWTGLTLVFVTQLGVVVLQTFQQGGSAKVLENMELDLQGMKGVLVTAVSVMQQTKGATAIASTGNSAVSAPRSDVNARQSTVAMALNDTVTNPSASTDRSLTPAQINLIGLSAADLVMKIREDFASLRQSQNAIDQTKLSDLEQYYIQQGMTKENAEKTAARTHVGSSWASHVNDAIQDAALQAIGKHQRQIDALIDIGKNDSSAHPSNLSAQLVAVSYSCNRDTINPATGVEGCVSALNRVITSSK